MKIKRTKVKFKRDIESGLSRKDFGIIKKRLKAAETKIRNETSFKNQPLTVHIRAGKRTAKMPTAGNSYMPHHIGITVDPENFANYFRSNDKTELLRTYAHERHHAQRWLFPKGYGTTLAEALVSEGLAEVFEEQMGYKTGAYSKNLSKKELLEFANLAREAILNNNEPDDRKHHNYWFYGQRFKAEQKPLIPLAGYSLGYALASIWLQENKKTATASKAAGEPAETILKNWLESGNEVLKPWLEVTDGFPPDRPAANSKAQPSPATQPI